MGREVGKGDQHPFHEVLAFAASAGNYVTLWTFTRGANRRARAVSRSWRAPRRTAKARSECDGVFSSRARFSRVSASESPQAQNEIMSCEPENKHARLSPGAVAGFVSRVLSCSRVAPRAPAVIPLGRASPRASCGLPRSSGGQPSNAPLRGLAPDGVCRAALVTERAVGSYSTFSPLPRCMHRGGLLFCGTFLEVTLTGRYPASCPVEPGLSSRRKIRRAIA
jgi:hypothetical protein